MNITYSQEKNFDAKTLLDFFTVSGNPDAKYEETLVEAINNAGTVVSAWDKDTNELAALITVVDDGKMTAYIRYLVVAPNYRGKGINDELIAQVKLNTKIILIFLLLLQIISMLPSSLN